LARVRSCSRSKNLREGCPLYGKTSCAIPQDFPPRLGDGLRASRIAGFGAPGAGFDTLPAYLGLWDHEVQALRAARHEKSRGPHDNHEAYSDIQTNVMLIRISGLAVALYKPALRTHRLHKLTWQPNRAALSTHRVSVKASPIIKEPQR